MELRQALRARGLRATRGRLAVLTVLSAGSQHLKVAEVHRRASAIEPGLGLATVYRTLELLVRLRLVQAVHTEHRHRHYARVTGRHGHHLICSGCGRVVEFSECGLAAVERALARRTRFQIEGHWVEFFGRCPRCRPRVGRRSRYACVG